MLPKLFLGAPELFPKLFLGKPAAAPKLFLGGSEVFPKLFRGEQEEFPKSFLGKWELFPKLFLGGPELLPKLFLGVGVLPTVLDALPKLFPVDPFGLLFILLAFSAELLVLDMLVEVSFPMNVPDWFWAFPLSLWGCWFTEKTTYILNTIF